MLDSVITSHEIERAAQFHNNPNRILEMSSRDIFLLLLWPSWVWKTTIMRELSETRYIGPYTTRELRPGETDKKHVSVQEYDDLQAWWQILFSNNLFGVRYGTPLAPVLEAQREWQIPVLDFPLDQVPSFADSVRKIIDMNFLCIYLFPPDMATWIQRMQADGRMNDARLSAGQNELTNLVQLWEPHPLIDLSLVSHTGKIDELVSSVRQVILKLRT